MTISIDRPAAAPETGSAVFAASALALLLQTHPELVGIPFMWRIDPSGIIRPGLDVDHPDAIRATELLAAALELPMQTEEYTSKVDGVRRYCVTVIGRWGGAEWKCSNYGTVQAPALRAVTA